jgi:hypothetical protein
LRAARWSEIENIERMPKIGSSVHSRASRYLPLPALGAYCTVPASMALRASCKA